ncbi:hypothetical protein LZ30DRAFT_483907 [Colletotrichum cereale]|nr:hypothetical protein LZ30DRAFT_483907 [Colletotrichum cereale]
MLDSMSVFPPGIRASTSPFSGASEPVKTGRFRSDGMTMRTLQPPTHLTTYLPDARLPTSEQDNFNSLVAHRRRRGRRPKQVMTRPGLHVPVFVMDKWPPSAGLARGLPALAAMKHAPPRTLASPGDSHAQGSTPPPLSRPWQRGNTRCQGPPPPPPSTFGPAVLSISRVRSTKKRDVPAHSTRCFAHASPPSDTTT